MIRIVLLALFLTPVLLKAQIAHDFQVGFGMDLVKTDLQKTGEKLQAGVEANYFLSRKFTATAGLEAWSGDSFSLVVGGRWYPVEYAFVKVRGLIGENDLAIGGGWTKPLNGNLKFEASADFYFKVDFAIRAGVVYVIRRKPK